MWLGANELGVTKRPTVAGVAGAIDFELHQLGWYAFEQLCRTICREVWQQPVEAYTRGPDGGRDGSFYGPWQDGSDGGSPAILQCKHMSNSAAHLAMSDLTLELKKVRRHVADGRCNVYVVMTNARVTGASAAAIDAAFQNVGVRRTIILGYEAMCEMLTEHKAMRALVPRLYGLGDLTEILDERQYAQAEAILATMHDQLARLIPVEAHRAGHRALRTHRFALLVGRPGSGKSSIAASLAVGAIDQYDARPVKLTRIEDLSTCWNPRDPHQFFWLDDSFGATQYDYAAANAWNRATPQIAAALRGGARLVLTSRDYIYAAARADLKLGAFPLIEEATVIIEVEAFTREEREQILYNHLKLGTLDRGVLRALRTVDLEAVAADASFLPELARRLGDPLFTRDAQIQSRAVLMDFFRRPKSFLLEVLVNLDRASRAALGLVHLHGNRLVSPYVEGPGDGAFLQRVGVSLGDAIRALSPLDGSLLRLTSSAGQRWWQFHHPTFTDAYQQWLADEPELLAEYIASARFPDLLRTITCGEVGLEGAVVVPQLQFELVLSRIFGERPTATGYERRIWTSAVIDVLGRRCAAAFVQAFITRDPGFVDDAFHVDAPVSQYASSALLAQTLLHLGLAIAAHRTGLVETLTDLAAEGTDGSFISDELWLQFFTERDLAELDRRVLDELDALDERVEVEISESGGDWASASDSVAGYEARYADHPEVLAARRRVERFQNYEPNTDEETEGSDDGEQELPRQPVNQTRSIFDDLAR